MLKFNENFISKFNTTVSLSESFPDLINNIKNLVSSVHFEHPFFLNSAIPLLNNITNEDIEKLFVESETIHQVGEKLLNMITRTYKHNFIKSMYADTFKNYIKKINFKSAEDFKNLKEKYMTKSEHAQMEISTD